MLKKQIAIFNMIFYVFIIWIFYYRFNKDKKGGRLLAKGRWQEVASSNIKNIFNEFNINGNIKKTNKINLIISNHISEIDILIIVVVLNHFNIKDWYFVFKDSLLKIPIFGSLCYDDIRLTRNWEKDQELLEMQLKNIKKGTIIIYPEGTRYTNKKHKNTLDFCYQNKLPIYNYTLAPKTRGFHSMYKILKENNTLGNIYDLTLIMPKFINRNINPLNFESFGSVHIFIEELQLDNNDLNYENLKRKLYLLWLNKNIIFDKFTKKHIKN